MNVAVSVLDHVQKALDSDVRPLIQAHGGDIKVLECHDGFVEVEFLAACAACELRPVTFAATVRRVLLRIDGVEDVRCSTVPLRPARLDAIANFFL